MEVTHGIGTPQVEDDWVHLEGEVRPVKFRGVYVADSLSDSHNPFQWTELTLYRKTVDTSLYMLHVVGQSTVYHSIDGCLRGVLHTLSELHDIYNNEPDADLIPRPCRECGPLTFDINTVKGSPIEVMMEVKRPSVRENLTVSELLETLKDTNRRNGKEYGSPALLLLARARRVDPAIYAELNKERIT